MTIILPFKERKDAKIPKWINLIEGISNKREGKSQAKFNVNIIN